MDGTEDDALYDDMLATSSRDNDHDSCSDSDEDAPGVPEGFFSDSDSEFDGFVQGKDF